MVSKKAICILVTSLGWGRRRRSQGDAAPSISRGAGREGREGARRRGLWRTRGGKSAHAAARPRAGKGTAWIMYSAPEISGGKSPAGREAACRFPRLWGRGRPLPRLRPFRESPWARLGRDFPSPGLPPGFLPSRDYINPLSGVDGDGPAQAGGAGCAGCGARVSASGRYGGAADAPLLSSPHPRTELAFGWHPAP